MPNVFLSGGSLNSNPELSLGGPPSSTPVQMSTAPSVLFGNVNLVERAAGKVEHRLVYVFATSPMTDVRAYVRTETPLSQTTIGLAWGGPVNSIAPSIPNDTTPPPGITFSEVTEAPLAPSGGNLAIGQWLPLWIRLRVDPGTPAVIERFGISFASSDAVPSILFPPALSGDLLEGATITMTNGEWDPPPTNYSYQWQMSVDGLTSWSAIGLTSSIVLASGQVGKYVRGRVIASNAKGPGDPSYTRVAGPVESRLPVNTVAPSLTGVAQEGSTLTASPGTWSNEPLGYNYGWRMSSDGIVWESAGGVGSSMVLTGTHVGKQIAVSVAGVNSTGAGTAVMSNSLGPVLIGKPVNTSVPVVDGLFESGQVLSGSNGSWTKSPTSYVYEWQQLPNGGSWAPISGATASTLTLTSDQAGKKVRLLVWASNAGGQSVLPGTSAETPTISGEPTVPAATPAGANEQSVLMSAPKLVSKKFFWISTWATPWYVLNGSPDAVSYGGSRYRAFGETVPYYRNNSTELTYLANGMASWDDFEAWVSHHYGKGADLMFHVYIKGGWGAATSLTQAQWNYVRDQIMLFLALAGGRVKYLCLATEPQFTTSPGYNPAEATSPGWPSKSASLYAQYCRIVKQTVAASSSAGLCKVVGPEIASLDPNRRLDAVHVLNTSAGGPDVGYGNGIGTFMKDWLDIFSFHGYHADDPANGGHTLISSMRTELNNIGFTKPMWQTEYMASIGTPTLATIKEKMARRHAAEVAANVQSSVWHEWGQAHNTPDTRWEEASVDGASLRRWWKAYTDWWRSYGHIGRIALLADNKIRVTRSDGAVLLIPDDLNNGKFDVDV